MAPFVTNASSYHCLLDLHAALPKGAAHCRRGALRLDRRRRKGANQTWRSVHARQLSNFRLDLGCSLCARVSQHIWTDTRASARSARVQRRGDKRDYRVRLCFDGVRVSRRSDQRWRPSLYLWDRAHCGRSVFRSRRDQFCDDIRRRESNLSSRNDAFFSR